MKKKFIIIRGPLGIGKSTVARAVAEKINGYYISIDEALKKWDLVKIEEDYVLADFIKLQEYLLPYIQIKLKQQSVVIDGNFYFQEQIEHLQKNINTDFAIFTLQASLKTCIERDRRRKNSYGEATTKAIYQLVIQFDIGKIINTENQAPDETAQEVLNQL